MVIDYCNFFGYCILYLDYFKGILVIVSLKSMFDNLSKQQNNKQSENKSVQPVQDAPQQPVAPKEDVSQKIERLREKGVKQGSRKKLYSIIGIAVILFFVGGVVAGSYFYRDDIINFLSSKDEGLVACAMDAKICPDGSSVGRVPPDCEFAECPVVAEKDYYQVLEDKCNGSSCCLSSVQRMRENNYKESDEYRNCPEGFMGNMLRCESSLKWCEPIKKGTICTQDAALNFFGTGQGNDPCDRSCESDDDCKLECGCECISKNEECIYTGIECEQPEPDYGCQCVNQTCKYNYIETENEINTSDWQTYRNEEIGIIFKYPRDWLFDIVEDNSYQLIPGDPRNCGEVAGEWTCLDRIYFGVIKNEKQLDIKTFLKEEYGWEPLEDFIIDFKEILIDNKKVFSFIALNAFDGSASNSFWVPLEDGNFFKISDSYLAAQLIETYNQILSTFKFLQDTDNDGFFDDEEAQYGCDINNPDSDGDGFLDGDEVENGYDPMGEGRLRSKK